MKTRLKKFLAVLLCTAMALPVSALTAQAAVATKHIEWYVKQNISDLDQCVAKNWPFGYQYYDVATHTFTNMAKDLGDTGWADSDSQNAVIKPWEQVATKSKYAVTIYYAQQKGALTVQNKQNFSGTGQVQLLQKNAEGKFTVLKDWFNAGTTWPTVKTYVKQGEMIYFMFRSTGDAAAVAQLCPQVAHDEGSSDTGNLYPATSAWKTESEVFGGSSGPIEPTVGSTTHTISWYVKQNAAGQAANYPNNWPFTYDYYDTATKTLKVMETDKGNDGWADSTGMAVVTPWQQMATNAKYAAVGYYANTKGNVRVENMNNAKLSGTVGNAQVMLLQKKADGTFSVLQDWKDIANAAQVSWENVTTYVNKGEMIYFIYRSTASTQSVVQNFTPQIVQWNGNEDTQSLYPKTWKTLEEVMGGGSSQSYPTQTKEISWVVTQNQAYLDGNYNTNWPFTFEYYDTATETFKKMEVDKGGSGWADTTEKAQVANWWQQANDSKYAVVTYKALQQGTVVLQNKDNAAMKAAAGADGQVMILQKDESGKFSVVQEWVTVAKGQSVPWSDSTTYMKKGEMIYFIFRGTADASTKMENLIPQVKHTLGNEDTANQYPTTWITLAEAFAPPVVPETLEISWYVQQWIQPWEGSKFSFEYFDTTKMAFHELEAWNCYETPAYWQDATGNIKIKGWEMVSSDVRYAATAFNASVEGVVHLTKDLKIIGSGANGEFMLLQKNAAGKYAVVLDWTPVADGEQVTIPNTSTYVKPGETVYYMYRSTTDKDLSVAGIEPKVDYQKYALDTAKQYPTEWKDIADIFEQKQDSQTPKKDYYQITTKVGNGGKIVAMNGSNAAGKDITYQFMVKSGYQISDVLVDGVSLGVTTKFTFTELSDDHTLEVKIKKVGANEIAWIPSNEEEYLV